MTLLEEIKKYGVLPEQIDFSHFYQYLLCPRCWFYRYILGLVPQDGQPVLDLVMGKAWHSALESGYIALQRGINNIQELTDISIEAFNLEWDNSEGYRIEIGDNPKSPTNAYKALRLYWGTYAQEHDEQEILAVEMPFSLPIGPGLPLLYGTVDLVSCDRNRYIVTEHKTTKTFGKQWQRNWENSFQVEAYSFATAMYYDVPDVCVSGTLFQKTLYQKEDPTVFDRLWVRKSRKQLDRFIKEYRYRLEQMATDTEQLKLEMRNGLDIQTAFPRQPSACHQYRTCPFYDICPTDVAPYKWERAPAGWKIEHQDGIYEPKEVNKDA